MALTVKSSAFAANKSIPVRYTGDGEDVSPPLSWGDVPTGTKSLALICDDPDAPTPSPWVHWVMYNIGADTAGLGEGVPAAAHPSEPAGAAQGVNSFGNTGYGGPAPPKGHGLHHYHFKLYALDKDMALDEGLTKEQVLDAIDGHVLGEGELVGTYER